MKERVASYRVRPFFDNFCYLYVMHILRNLYLAILLLGVCIPLSHASHLLGSTITYTHVKNKEYRITAVLYRDCNECSLGDYGGGSSGVKCDDLEALYLALSNRGECSRKNLGKIDLERVGYSNITPVCNGTQTACDGDPDVDFGIERHEYVGTIDFDDYSMYEGCGFDIFMLLSNARNTTSTVSSEQSLYNYAYIDPWRGENSSRIITDQPRFYADCQKTFKSRMGGTDPDGDRLTHHLMPPKSGVSTNLQYNSGFSAINPFTVWCDGESNCSPDPNANPPKGFSLNSEFGDLVFYPTKCDESGLFVVETREWRKIDGKEYLVGLTRQDIQVSVRTPFNNNHPEIQSKNDFVACVGDSLIQTIHVKDSPFKFADGTTSKQDSVSLSFDTNLPNGSVEIIETSEAPYRQIRINFLPRMHHSGETFYLRVFAKDNFCPVPGKDVKTVWIKVSDKPTLNLDGKIVFCDWIEVVSPKEAQVWQISGKDSSVVVSGKQLVRLSEGNDFHFYARSENAYGCTSQDSFKGKWSKDHLVTYQLPNALCEEEPFKVSASSRFKVNRLNWLYNGAGGSNSGNETAELNAQDSAILIEAQIENNDLKCAIKKTVIIPVIHLPEIKIPIASSPCAHESPLQLDSMNVEPSGGNWIYSGPGDFKYNRLEWNPIYPTGHSLEYIIEDPSGKCSKSKEVEFTTRQSPQLKLKELIACQDLDELRLSYFVDGNFDFDQTQFSWKWDGDPGRISNSDQQVAVLQTNGLPVGDYQVTLAVINSEGCEKTESTRLTILKERSIAIEDVEKLCATDTIDLDQVLKVSPASGYWSSGNFWDILDNRYLIPRDCETIQLTYSIDEFGCYSSQDFEFEPICSPSELPDIPGLICENAGPIDLRTDGWKTGVWQVNGVENTRFEPSLHTTVNRVSFEGETTEGCHFRRDWDVQIEEIPEFSLVSTSEPWCEDQDLEIVYSANGPFDISVDCSSQAQLDADLIRISKMCSGDLKMKVVGYGEVCPDQEWVFPFQHLTNPVIPELLGIENCSNEEVRIDLRQVPQIGEELNWILKDANGVTLHAGKHSEPIKLLPLSAGEYDLGVELTSAQGCVSRASLDDFVSIEQAPKALFHIEHNRFMQNERSFQPENLSSTYGQTTFNWLLGNNGNIATFTESEPKIVLPPTPGQYQLTLVAQSNTCKDEYTATLEVLDQTSIFIPNAFSPDTKGPEENKTFGVSGNHISSVKIEVHNRWGQLMFTTEDGKKRWDGTSRGGNACAAGTYFYQITVTDKEGHNFSYAGTVNLLR
jgi:gliding motility-associated-like protein